MTEQQLGEVFIWGLVALAVSAVVIIWFAEAFDYIDRKAGKHKDRHDD